MEVGLGELSRTRHYGTDRGGREFRQERGLSFNSRPWTWQPALFRAMRQAGRLGLGSTASFELLLARTLYVSEGLVYLKLLTNMSYCTVLERAS